MAKRNIFKNRGKTYIFSNKGGGGESGITVTPLTVTENGTYTSAAGQAYSPVTVRVEGDVEVEDNKPVSISENGTVVINPTSGKDAMAKVTATVNVTPVLETKTITENGTYTPTAGKDGFSEVTVNVSGGGVNTLFAWVSSGYYVYTTTANPTTQDEAYVLDSEGTNIYTEEITEVGEGTITIEKYGTSTYEYERAADADITLQAGEGGVSTLYAFAVTDDEYVYYATKLDLEAGDKLLVITITGYDPANDITIASYDSSTNTATDEYGRTYQYDSTKNVVLQAGGGGQGTKLYGYSEEAYGSEYTGRHLFATEDIDTSVTGSGTASLVFADQAMDGMVKPEENVPYTTDAEEGTVRFDGETVDIPVYRRPDLDVIVDSGGLEIENNKSISITQNGTVVINPTSGKDAMAKVTATVNIPSADIETEKTVSITQNGTYIINPTTGKDAMAKVTATVNVATATVEGTNLILSSGSVSGNTLNL